MKELDRGQAGVPWPAEGAELALGRVVGDVLARAVRGRLPADRGAGPPCALDFAAAAVLAKVVEPGACPRITRGASDVLGEVRRIPPRCGTALDVGAAASLVTSRDGRDCVRRERDLVARLEDVIWHKLRGIELAASRAGEPPGD